MVVGRAKAIAKGREDGHETAEACRYCESVLVRFRETAKWHDKRQGKAGKILDKQHTIHLRY